MTSRGKLPQNVNGVLRRHILRALRWSRGPWDGCLAYHSANRATHCIHRVAREVRLYRILRVRASGTGAGVGVSGTEEKLADF